MADHSKPVLTSTYSNFITELDGRFDDLAVGLDPAVTTATNVPTNSIRWNSVNSYWQKYNGSTWVVLTSVYGISVSGNAGSATQVNTSITFNNAGTGAASGTTFNGSTARTISYNTIGAPSITGANASGTWAISVTGTASNVNITNDNTSTGVHYLYMGTAISGGAITKVASTKLTFTPSTGDLTASGNITSSSDIKLKTDLVKIENALDKVSRLTGYVYTRKDTGQKQTGLIAQDVMSELPEAVSTSGEYLSVAYGNLMGLIVEAIKELKDEVEVLRTKIN